jgi:hypothetical protein
MPTYLKTSKMMVVVVMGVVLALSPFVVRAADEKATPSLDAADLKVERALAAEIPTVDIEDMKFVDAIATFRELVAVPIHVNWNALKAAGVVQDSRINIHLKKIAASKVLELILSDATTATVDVDYIVDGGILRISTTEDLNRVVVTRIYYIGDMLQRRGQYPYWAGPRPATTIHPRSRGYTGGYGGAATDDASTGGGLFEEESGPDGLTQAQLVENVKSMVTEMVDPDSWSDSTRVGIRSFGPRLLVTQTLSGHRRIEALLGQLRKERFADQMINFHARWVLIDREKAAAMLAGKAKGGTLEVSEESLKAADAKVAYEARLTCFAGQVVHLAAGNVQTLLTQLEPVVGEASSALRPVMTGAIWGALLEASAAVDTEGEKAEVSLRSIVGEPTDSSRKTVRINSHQPSGQKEPTLGPTVELDMPAFDLQTFSTNIRVPLGTAVLIGGTTMPSKDGTSRVLYLVLDVSLAK